MPTAEILFFFFLYLEMDNLRKYLLIFTLQRKLSQALYYLRFMPPLVETDRIIGQKTVDTR